jgi:uncharacterized protein Yka (UPF0111/DUF47 family)
MTTTPEEPDNTMPPTLDSVLDRFVGSTFSPTDREAIQAALVEREDAVADFLRMAARQFGLFPQIVAEVLAETGLGTAPSPEVRNMIHRQFHELMQQVERAQRGDGPMPTP